mmetsp:Transcript_19033/g.30323  ORF Transcript_19033/g.30323 Transcript_19033/m.30323 type:complete len:233 (+) Transcript_19033:338-1036(+)
MGKATSQTTPGKQTDKKNAETKTATRLLRPERRETGACSHIHDPSSSSSEKAYTTRNTPCASRTKRASEEADGGVGGRDRQSEKKGEVNSMPGLPVQQDGWEHGRSACAQDRWNDEPFAKRRCPGERVRVEGLKSEHYNGLLGTLKGGLNGGRLRVILDPFQDENDEWQHVKILSRSLKSENLVLITPMIVDSAGNRAGAPGSGRVRKKKLGKREREAEKLKKDNEEQVVKA